MFWILLLNKLVKGNQVPVNQLKYASPKVDKLTRQS